MTAVKAGLLVVGTVTKAPSPWFVATTFAFLVVHVAIIAIQRR